MKLESAEWIWISRQEANTYCYARKIFDMAGTVLRANLRIVVDSRYQVWLNGRYIGQGPVPFRRPWLCVDTFEVQDLLLSGENVLCVLAHFIGQPTETYTPGRAGILAQLDIECADGSSWSLGSDETWRVKLSEAWEKEVPRRTWATGFCEFYDARHEPVGWTSLGFDDSQWSSAHPVEQGELHLLPRIVPPLEEIFVSPVKLVGAWQAGGSAPGAEIEPGLTEFLDVEPLNSLKPAQIARLESELFGPEPCVLELSSGRGLVLTLDFGAEIVGHPEFEIEAPPGGEIDVCGAELLRHGRPWCYRKRGLYASRYLTRSGRQVWRTFGWTGLRYLHIVLRGFDEPVILHCVGVWRRQARLVERGSFRCNDDKLNCIWEIGCHTIRVGSQEVQVDCPTREQAVFWADHIWTGLWMIYLSGDSSFLKHMLLSAGHVQRADGQLPAAIFCGLDYSGGLPFYDFTLIMLWGVWEYYWHTGDRILARHLLPVMEKALQWYRQRLGPSGLIEFDAVAAQEASQGMLFIDHPGMGWHNCPHPGLDRRGISAGLNLFYLKALTAYTKLTRTLEQPAVFSEEEIKSLKQKIHQAFWDPGQAVYVDALIESKPSNQVSQQINALAIVGGVCPAERARGILTKVLDPDDKSLCRCTPYFWLYMFQAMSLAGMHPEMLEVIRKYWGAMVEAGATTWWETFLGDERDSLCHPYSSVPNYVFGAEILGVKPASPGFANTRVCPRCDLIPQAEGVIPLPGGEVEIGWMAKSSHQTDLHLDIRGGFDADLILPSGWVVAGTEQSEVKIGGNSRLRIIVEGHAVRQ